MSTKRAVWIVPLVLLAASLAAAQNAHGPGRVDVPLIAGQFYEAGTVTIHNNNGGLLIDIEMANGWHLAELQVHAGWADNPVPTVLGNPVPGKFDHKFEYGSYAAGQEIFLDFVEDLQGFRWGEPYEAQRLRHIAVHADVVLLDAYGTVTQVEGAWAQGDIPFEGGQWGWWLKYMMAHKARFHFIDAPVAGLRVITETEDVLTDGGGGGPYFPGETGSFYLGMQPLGTTELDHRISPLDLFPEADIEDPRVANMAMLLQSLDADGDLSKTWDDDDNLRGGIQITPEVRACFNQALGVYGIITDWSADDQVEALVDATIDSCDGVPEHSMVKVNREDAVAHLEKTLSSLMFRKNVSKTPEMGTTKSKLDLMPVLVPATLANGTPTTVEYFAEDGITPLYTRDKVRPLVSVYADEVPETGGSDTFGAISRDDGKTWKRMNLSRGAKRSSFTLATGYEFPGQVKKPNLKVKGNYVLAVWQSKFCRGGRPTYSIQVCPDTDGDGDADPCIVCKGEGENEHCDWDDPSDDIYYEDDIWGVGGPQRSHDYTEDGFPEVGELPYYCLWVCRGTVDELSGDISWRKPERLTSGRRDVWQVAVNGAKDVGFGVIWQEDPEGVRPGEMMGPGHGWSGATTNHKTDIWYTSITWEDFAPIDENFSPNGDPNHSFDDPEWTTNRPMPLVPFPLPIRLSDNDTCNTDNLKVETDESTGLPLKDSGGNYVFTPIQDPFDPEWDGKHAGTHRYAYLIDDNGNGIPDLCADFYTFVNEQGATKNVCITEDGRLLDGDTGASRPNLMYMPYQKTINGDNPATPNVTETSYKVPSAWAAIVYEETKGVGGGAPDHTGEPPYGGEDIKPDSGKNVIYHSFEFSSPVPVSGGDIVNLPAQDADGNLLYLIDYETGLQVLDYLGRPQLAYENARRPRMLVQPPGQAGDSGTVMVLVYKQGEEGKGRQSDIFLRRVNKKLHTGNPFAFWNFACNETAFAENGQTVCVDGAQNMSSVLPTEYWENPNQDDQAKGEGIKVVKYTQTGENLADASWTNPYEDARAHRGIIKGNNVFLAYDYTPNWAPARNAHDKYDLFIRRSFDGGQTWTTDPSPVTPQGVDADFDNSQVCHTNIWKKYTNDDGTPLVSEDEVNKKETYEETECFGPGAFEPARNMSQLKNNKLTVIEPRLVGTPGTPPEVVYDEDVQDSNVYWVTFGTATNVPKLHGNNNEDEEEEESVPADLYYTFTRDRGQTYYKKTWIVNPDSLGNWAGEEVTRYDYLAKGDPEQGEAQIRMTPDGSRFYAVWNQDGVEGSDCWFRRIMSPDFPQNVVDPPPAPEE